MAKRRLSEQQQKRIQGNQQQRIDNSRRNRNGSGEASGGPDLQGLVMARYSRHVDIKAEEGERRGEIIRCHVRANLPAIAAGDHIVWQEAPQQEGVIVAVRERHSLIERPDGFGNLKPVAANIDQLFIVLAPEPEPHPNLIDRYLVAAENAHIAARLVFNKTDLLQGSNPHADLLATYRSLDYPVFEISCTEQTGLDAIRQALQDRISLFVGQSGVGKSSLINALLPDTHTKVGNLSDLVTKGRHTTTTASLFELPDGGYLIDSPGIREFHLHHFSREQVFAGYRELQEAIGHCQFRDCQHRQEPGCAVKAVIESGKLSPTRRQTLEYILNSLEN